MLERFLCAFGAAKTLLPPVDKSCLIVYFIMYSGILTPRKIRKRIEVVITGLTRNPSRYSVASSPKFLVCSVFLRYN